MDCNLPQKYVGGTKDCNVQYIAGILYSAIPVSITDADAQVFSNIDALLSAPLGSNVQFLKFDTPPEVTSKENTVDTGINGIETKTSYTAPKFISKIKNMTPDRASRWLSEFGNGRKGYYAAVYAQGAIDFIRNTDGTLGFAPVKIHENEDWATDAASRMEGISLQPIDYEVYKKLVVRVFDKTYNSSSDYYSLVDFYATTPASTTVADGGLTDITFTAQSSEGVALSGLVKDDIDSVLIDAADEISKATTLTETPAGSGTYVLAGSAAYSAGSATVVMKAQADLSISGFAFTEANAGTLA